MQTRVPALSSGHSAANRNHDLESLSWDSRAVERGDNCRCRWESIPSPGYDGDKNVPRSHLPRTVESSTREGENDVGAW